MQKVFGAALVACSLLFGMNPASAAVSVTPGSASLYGVDVSHPSSGVVLDGNLWISDRLDRFCRLDPNPNAVDNLFQEKPIDVATPNLAPTACPSGNIAVALQPGQPAYDAASGYIFVPDTSAKNSAGVVRYHYNTSTKAVDALLPQTDEQHPQLVAPTAGLAGLRPTAVAMGPDHNLYVASYNSGDIKKVTNPTGPAGTQTVVSVGKAAKSNRVFGLTFIGNTLFLAEKTGISAISNATSPLCTGGCSASLLGATGGVEVDAVVSDGINTLWYTQGDSVFRWNLSGAPIVLAQNGTLTPDQVPTSSPTWYTGDCVDTNCPLRFTLGKASLSLDAATDRLFIGDDPNPLDASFYGRVWVTSAYGAPAS